MPFYQEAAPKKISTHLCDEAFAVSETVEDGMKTLEFGMTNMFSMHHSGTCRQNRVLRHVAHSDIEGERSNCSEKGAG